MSLSVPNGVMGKIQAHLEKQYPDEGAGLLLGTMEGEIRTARQAWPMPNQSGREDRPRRYSIDPKEILRAEQEADRLGLQVVGVYHSHPDHPPAPSQFDLEWAVPWYVYLITSVENGMAAASRAWRLLEDHSEMVEETFRVEESI